MHVNAVATEVYACARMYAHMFACVRMCVLSTLSMQLYHCGSASLHLHLCMHAFEIIFFARGHACVRKSKHSHACLVTAFV